VKLPQIDKDLKLFDKAGQTGDRILTTIPYILPAKGEVHPKLRLRVGLFPTNHQQEFLLSTLSFVTKLPISARSEVREVTFSL
jgi:hypothetical protein